MGAHDMDPLSRACRLEALLRCAMLAEENETSGVEDKGLNKVLECAVEMTGALMEDIERLQQKHHNA